ncbi:MAG: class II aldolase/adducin family protein [Eubacteriaceae bacterium]|nr:class II aldolase/adducin family protein [Eubacteriaceae bacterium]
MTASEVKRKIIEVVQTEYKNGMVNMFEGNVSARFEDRFFITPSQVEKMSMEEDMIIEIDKDGNILYAKEGYKPSSELFMHLEVYKLRPDVNAVVHNHSLYATAFAVNNMPLETDALTEANISFGPIPVVPYGTPGTDKIYKDFDKYLIDNWAVLPLHDERRGEEKTEERNRRACTGQQRRNTELQRTKQGQRE